MPKRQRSIGYSEVSHKELDVAQFAINERKKPSRINRLLRELDRSIDLSTSTSNQNQSLPKKQLNDLNTYRSFYVGLDCDWLCHNQSILQSISLESNFNLFPLHKADMSVQHTITSLFYHKENTVHHCPHWEFPPEIGSSSTASLRKELNRREYWPPTDSDISTHISISSKHTSEIKILSQRWQDALFSLFDGFIGGKGVPFQVIGNISDSSFDNSTTKRKSNTSFLNLATSFHYQGGHRNSPAAIVVGAGKPFLKRILDLDGRPYIMTSEGKKSSSSSATSSDHSQVSTAGRMDKFRAGQNILLIGTYNLSVLLHCILEQVFFPRGPNSLQMLVDHLPTIRSTAYFKHAVPVVAVARAVGSSSSASYSRSSLTSQSFDKEQSNSHQRALLLGDISISGLKDLAATLIAVAIRSPVTESKMTDPDFYLDSKELIHEVLTGRNARGSVGDGQKGKQNIEQSTVRAPTSSFSTSAPSPPPPLLLPLATQPLNPMTLLSTKSSVVLPAVTKADANEPSPSKIENNEATTLSTSQWLRQVRERGYQYFILRPTLKSNRLVPFAYSEAPLDGIAEEGEELPPEKQSDSSPEASIPGPDLVQEVRWHSGMGPREVAILCQTAPNIVLQRAKKSDWQVPSNTELGEEEEEDQTRGVLLQPLNAYSIFVDK